LQGQLCATNPVKNNAQSQGTEYSGCIHDQFDFILDSRAEKEYKEIEGRAYPVVVLLLSGSA
jgi:hypothetical protein